MGNVANGRSMKALLDGWDLFETVLRMEEQKIRYPVTFGECPSCLPQILTRVPMNTQKRRKMKLGLFATLMLVWGGGILIKFKVDEHDIQ